MADVMTVQETVAFLRERAHLDGFDELDEAADLIEQLYALLLIQADAP